MKGAQVRLAINFQFQVCVDGFGILLRNALCQFHSSLVTRYIVHAQVNKQHKERVTMPRRGAIHSSGK